MLIGYARTSTTDQIAGLEAQERDLLAQGCERLWREQTSALGPRTALEEAIAFARSGDSLVVTKICRLARSVANLVAIIDRLEKKGVSLRILSMGIDTATPTGRLMLNLLASISQFEREVMLERQREGVAKAKGLGKYKGRKPTARAKSDQILELDRQGLSREGIAGQLGIGVASVYRVLKSARVVA
jgi:DNA invertase Pin-like site-specific DNA recombinase